MDNSRSIWRIRAKVVAYVDLVLLSIELLAVIGLVLVSTGVAVFGATTIASATPDTSTRSTSSYGSWYGQSSGSSSNSHINHGSSNSSAVAGLFTFAAALLWILAGFLAILIGLQMWAALKLLNSTELGKDAQEAVGKARTWRNVSIVFFVFAVIGMFTLPTWYNLFIIVWRAGFIAIVFFYIKELEEIIVGQNNSYPVNVMVAKC